MKNIGARMETLRNDMNLTPQAVSSYLDIPTEELLDMENGKKNITLSVLNHSTNKSSFSVLKGVASMNRIYLNMKYLTSKMDD